MNYLKIEKASINNGPGVRVVLWVSGCNIHCKGCQNPESWNFNVGKLFDDAAKQELFEALNKPYIRGITFSGGNPIEGGSINEVYTLCKEIKEKFPTKDIWLYTGYVFENIHSYLIMKYIDVLVDGPYIEEQRDITLAFRGSKNQRLIDVKETFKQNKIVTIQN